MYDKQGILYGKKFEDFYKNSAPGIYRYLLSLCRDKQDAEDLLQETFISVYNSIDSFKGNSKLNTWAYKIATNKFRDFLRRKKNKNDHQHNMIEIQTLSSFSPEDFVLAKSRLQNIKNAVDELPPKLKATLFLVKIEGMKYREAAEVLNISLSTVRMQVHRAVQLLLEKLKEEDFG